jgi:hypothetical protein
MSSGNVMPRDTNTAGEGGGDENASLDARITDLEGKIADLDEAFYAQGQEGQEGKPASEGTEGPGGEVGPEGTTTETFLEEVKPNGEVEPPLSERKIERKGGITKTNLKTEAEKEGIGGGLTDYRITIEVAAEKELLPKIMQFFRWEELKKNALSVGGAFKITQILNKKGEEVLEIPNPDPFVGSVGYVGFALGGGNETHAWVMSISGKIKIIVWTEEKHNTQVGRSFPVNLIMLP